MYLPFLQLAIDTTAARTLIAQPGPIDALREVATIQHDRKGSAAEGRYLINCPDDAVDNKLMRVAEDPATDHREYYSFLAKVHRRQERADVCGAQELPAERLRLPGDGPLLPIAARSESRGEDLGYQRFSFDRPIPRVAENDLCVVVHADTDLIEILLNCSSGRAKVSDLRGL